jgi:hypothetical protein
MSKGPFDQRLNQVQGSIENPENQAQEEEEEWQPGDNQEGVILYFCEILERFVSCMQSLQERASGFSTMQTLGQKRQAIVGSNPEFSTMQDYLTRMGRAIKVMPTENRGSFEETLAECQEVITELRAWFAALDEKLQRLIRDEEAQAEEGGRNAPDDGWLNRFGITLAVLLVIAAIGAIAPIVLPHFCPSLLIWPSTAERWQVDPTAIGRKEGPAEVTKTGPVDKTQKRRRHGTRAPGGSQDATAVGGKERTAEATKATKTGPSDKTQRRRRFQTKAPSGSQDATAVGGKQGTAEVTDATPADKTQRLRRSRTQVRRSEA